MQKPFAKINKVRRGENPTVTARTNWHKHRFINWFRHFHGKSIVRIRMRFSDNKQARFVRKNRPVSVTRIRLCLNPGMEFRHLTLSLSPIEAEKMTARNGVAPEKMK
ncbi:MAG TPA: hypothetical protein VFR76_04935 [Verrucomicrobiae bacterium]|nr:hypothetical protein [Verrucomicrobiae bacterium]